MDMNTTTMNIIEMNIYNKMDFHLNVQNKELRQQVAALEEEICLRTRNYLLYSSRRKDIVSCRTAAVQCDPYLPQHTLYARSFKKEDRVFTTPLRAEPFDDSLISQHPNTISTPNQSEEDSSSVCTEGGTNGTDSGLSNAKLYRKIDKLTKKLNKQIQANEMTRVGLLLSEEENYKFRLQLQVLREKIKNYQVELNTTSKYQEIKKETLGTVAALRKENSALIIENSQLRRYVKRLETIEEPFSYLTIQDYEKFVEIVKQKTFLISNNMPQSEAQEDASYFRPKNPEQVINLLNRIQANSQVFKKWEQQKWQLISSEKAKFLQFIEAVSTKNGKVSKQILLQQLQKFESIKPYAQKILNGSHVFIVDESATNLLNLSVDYKPTVNVSE